MNVSTLEPRLLPQLERFARSRPERLAQLLARLREDAPEIFEELVLTGLEHGDISPEEGALILNLSPEDLADRQERYRAAISEGEEASLIVRDRAGIARVAGSIIAVWELVRAFRKAGTVAALHKLFPSLTETELRAALAYAGRHPEEVQARILAYEQSRLDLQGKAVVNSQI